MIDHVSENIIYVRKGNTHENLQKHYKNKMSFGRFYPT